MKKDYTRNDHGIPFLVRCYQNLLVTCCLSVLLSYHVMKVQHCWAFDNSHPIVRQRRRLHGACHSWFHGRHSPCRKDCVFLHTTRYQIKSIPPLFLITTTLSSLVNHDDSSALSNNTDILLTTSEITATTTSVTYSVSRLLSRDEAQTVLNGHVMPTQDYGNRMGWGRDAHGLSGLIAANDPRLGLTYGEFPLTSMDQLVDWGLSYCLQEPQQQPQCQAFGGGAGDATDDRRRRTLVDIGSGCGRLVLYNALSRGQESDQDYCCCWTVHGIEIAELLHMEGLNAISKAVAGGWISSESSFASRYRSVNDDNNNNSNSIKNKNLFSLHLGPANEYRDLLNQADVVFAYSTAFSSPRFSPELGAMLLETEWSQLLSESCQLGCVAITTDRVLDPAYGWEVVHRIDVENPEVYGSTGYIHVLRQQPSRKT
jgi:hypothetical protein